MERPSFHDETVRQRAALALHDDVADWLRQEGSYDEDKEKDEVIEQLADALTYTDGYDIAKSLERDGWVPDSELVEILDSAYGALRDAHLDEIRLWVQKNQIRPQFKVGDRVRWKDHNGTIVRILEDIAMYVVQKDDKEYDPPKVLSDGTTMYYGVYVDYEMVTED